MNRLANTCSTAAAMMTAAMTRAALSSALSSSAAALFEPGLHKEAAAGAHAPFGPFMDLRRDMLGELEARATRGDRQVCAVFVPGSGPSRAVTGAFDGLIRLWDLEGVAASSGTAVSKPLMQLNGHRSHVNSSCFWMMFAEQEVAS